MFKQSLMDKIFMHERMKKIPIAYQMDAYKAIEEILEREVEEFPYLYLAHIFQDDIQCRIQEV